MYCFSIMMTHIIFYSIELPYVGKHSIAGKLRLFPLYMLHNEAIHELPTCLQLLISHSQKHNMQKFVLHSYCATWTNLDFRNIKTLKAHIQLSSEYTCFISPSRRMTPSSASCPMHSIWPFECCCVVVLFIIKMTQRLQVTKIHRFVLYFLYYYKAILKFSLWVNW